MPRVRTRRLVPPLCLPLLYRGNLPFALEENVQTIFPLRYCTSVVLRVADIWMLAEGIPSLMHSAGIQRNASGMQYQMKNNL